MLDTVLAERKRSSAPPAGLHVTPSAVSNALARLRAALDDPLFIPQRAAASVPTPRAAALAPAPRRAPCATSTRRFHRRGIRSRDDRSRVSRSPRADLGQGREAAADRGGARRKDAPRAPARAEHRTRCSPRAGSRGPRSTSRSAPARRGPASTRIPLYEERIALVARAGHPTIRRPRHEGPARDAPARRGAGGAGGMATGSCPPRYATLGIVRHIAVIVAEPSPAAGGRRRQATDSRRVAARQPGERARGQRAWRCGAWQRRSRRSRPPSTLLWHERTHQDPALRAFRELLVEGGGRAPRAPRAPGVTGPGSIRRSAST